MSTRHGGFLVSSLVVHGALFAALASTPLPAGGSQRIEMVEFVAITDEGGGRIGNDTKIGDAVEPSKPPEKIFRQVKPKPKAKAKAPPAKPRVEEPEPEAPAQDWSGVAAAEAATEGESSGATSHSMIRGSAGSDRNATAAGIGSGEGGVDLRSALRAWLREIQREANKIASRNYPSSAVRQGLQGKLRLGITIGQDGSILAVRVLSSCGHAVLDDAARESVWRLRIPAPPPELGWREREIALPVRYALQ